MAIAVARLLLLFAINNCLEAEGLEGIAQAFVEFAHELHPVQTQGMQESRQALHHDQDGQSEQAPGAEDDEQANGTGIGWHF